MPRPLAVDLDVLRAVAAPHALLTTRCLRELGVTPSTIWRRCRPGGPWTLVARGVVWLGNGSMSAVQRLVAAQLYGGPDAVVTGLAATHTHGLRRGDEDAQVHVLVPHMRHVAACRLVLVERTCRMPPAQLRDGVRLAPVTRAVLDAVRRLDDRDEVRAIVAEAVQRRRTTPERLVEELERGTTRGTALVRAVLAEVSDGVRSAAEGWARDTARSTGLPSPLLNVDLHGPDGFLARPDAYWAEVGLAWQIDSREWHVDPEGWMRTQWRRRLLEDAGVLGGEHGAVVAARRPRGRRPEPACGPRPRRPAPSPDGPHRRPHHPRASGVKASSDASAASNSASITARSAGPSATRGTRTSNEGWDPRSSGRPTPRRGDAADYSGVT